MSEEHHHLFATMPQQSAVYPFKAIANGHQRHVGTIYMEEASDVNLPSNDRNDWYYPALPSTDSEEDTLHVGAKGGNWGNKTAKGARWIRRGKKAAWGPGRDEWEVEERARKRIKSLLPQSRSPSPPSLPHLRSPSPPLTAPYPRPDVQHTSYASFVLDPAVSHSFRSNLLTDLEHTTANLIEGEASMRRTLGKLWQVLSEDPDLVDGEVDQIAKQEEADDHENDDIDERERRIARAPDLTNPTHKLFLTTFGHGETEGYDGPPLGSPQAQLETLEKAVATIKELHDDGREYMERLAEIREGLGDLRTQRNSVWTKVRESAYSELREIVTTSGL
ncbi:hypothetical protein BD410DRAFT_738528 [Rickenella mellea]|uniref:Transcriptional regulatory protein RXT2 N-terminal domain-containing protein n=1 Tax=Rickenella mellea TaxID=50990 RepID=A0A4Y7QN57_9AGAM|nr:hypothetical protein BD410DRAFT_738528 [Rickenella mellea]